MNYIEYKRNRGNNLMIYLLFLSIFVTSFDFYLSQTYVFSILKSSLWDELIVAYIFLYTVALKRSSSGCKQKGFFRLLIVISIIGIVGNIQTNSSLEVISLGLFSFMKPLLIFWSLCQYDFEWKDFMKFMHLFTFFLPLIFVSYIIDFMTPEFRQIMGLGDVEERMGIRSLGGLFRKQTLGVVWFQVYCIFYLFYSANRHKWLSYFSIAMIFMSLKVKDIFGFIMGWSTLFVRKIKPSYLLVGIMLVFVLFNLYASVMPEHYEKYFEEDEDSNFARVALTYTSLKIASDHMPFGVGFGKYGSPTSRDTHSEIYHEYGIDGIYGLTEYSNEEQTRNFMCDTFWPMILGETGVVGTVCYIFILICAFLPFFKEYIKDTHDRRVLFPCVLFVIFLVTTIGKPVLMGPPHSLVLWGITGIFFSLKDKNYPYKKLSY